MLSCILCRTNNNNHILDFRICNTANHIPLCVYTVSFTIFFRNPSSISFELFIPIFFRFIVRTIELTIHIFQIVTIPKEQIVTKRYEKENAERKNHLQDLQTQRNKAEKDLLALKTEVLACLKGESVLPRETLAEMITAQEEKLTELENLCEAASEELEKTAELMDKVSRLYDELISYADLYDSANFEAKKMIVNQLIRRVDVYRGYQINISFNFDLTPYIEGE